MLVYRAPIIFCWVNPTLMLFGRVFKPLTRVKAKSALPQNGRSETLAVLTNHSYSHTIHSTMKHRCHTLPSLADARSKSPILTQTHRIKSPWLFNQHCNRKTLTKYIRSRVPDVLPIVVGSEAAHTPSLFRVFSSIPEATTSGGTH